MNRWTCVGSFYNEIESRLSNHFKTLCRSLTLSDNFNMASKCPQNGEKEYPRIWTDSFSLVKFSKSSTMQERTDLS